MKRKLMIVIEETGGNNGEEFNVYLAGDIERLKTLTDTDKMSPAEFWATQFFKICTDALLNSGVINDMRTISKDEVH